MKRRLPRVTVAGIAPHMRKRRGALKVAGAALGLFLAGYLLAVFVLFPPPEAPEDGIVVPDLKGQSLEQARERLRPLQLEIGDTISMPHPSVPFGIVVAQSPLVGQQLRAGGQVSVGLSSGLASVAVPDVTGLAARRASNLLTRLGFQVEEALEMSERPNGIVVRSNPEAGVRQPLPARVVLYVSSGPPPDTMQIDTLLPRRDTTAIRDTTSTVRRP
jgi:beta-lactam-binding protein with PASTA domain